MPDKHYFRSIIVNLTVILLSIIGFAYGINIFTDKLTQQTATITQQKSDLYRYSRAPEALAQLKKDENKAQAYLKLLNNFLPNQDDLFINFGKWMTAQAGKRSVNVTTNLIAKQPAPGYENLGLATFQADAGGTIEDVLAFFNEIETENTKYIINIENIDVSKGPGYDRVVARGNVYFQNDPLQR